MDDMRHSVMTAFAMKRRCCMLDKKVRKNAVEDLFDHLRGSRLLIVLRQHWVVILLGCFEPKKPRL
jgi:hypothetical protein